MVEVQDQKAYQKQRGITGVYSGSVSKKTPGKNGARWYKSVGLGFKTPKEAIEGNYIDKKCPFTGNVSIRGRILTGVVKSTKVRRVRGPHFIRAAGKPWAMRGSAAGQGGAVDGNTHGRARAILNGRHARCLGSLPRRAIRGDPFLPGVC
jgi:hypothetical protein